MRWFRRDTRTIRRLARALAVLDERAAEVRPGPEPRRPLRAQLRATARQSI